MGQALRLLSELPLEPWAVGLMLAHVAAGSQADNSILAAASTLTKVPFFHGILSCIPLTIQPRSPSPPPELKLGQTRNRQAKRYSKLHRDPSNHAPEKIIDHLHIP